jgi:hypothetical protein
LSNVWFDVFFSPAFLLILFQLDTIRLHPRAPTPTVIESSAFISLFYLSLTLKTAIAMCAKVGTASTYNSAKPQGGCYRLTSSVITEKKVSASNVC